MKTLLVVLLGLFTLADAQGVAPLSDADGDGLAAAVEWALGTDPGKPDTDGDGCPDGLEAQDPLGDALDPSVRKTAPGLRVLAWREGGEAWVLLITREPGRPALTGRWLGGPPHPLEGGLLEVSRAREGPGTWALPFAAGLLPAVGGQWALGARLGRLTARGTLLERGVGWVVLEFQGEERARAVPAERGAARPFPGAQTPSRVCGQALQRIEGAALVVVREDCAQSGPFCILDCGLMTGHLILNPSLPIRPR